MNVPLHPLPQRQTAPGGQHANDHALQTKAGARLKVDKSPNFQGIVQDGYIPPDPNIAVSQDYIVEVVNSEIAVFIRNSDGTINFGNGYPKKLGALWTAMGGDCAKNNAGDPTVLYDRSATSTGGRWLITQLGSVRSPYSECFAVSTSSDPTGTYNLYQYSFGSNLNDYPKFGVWPTATNSAYLGTYNLFSHGRNFVGGEFCFYERQAMIDGASSPKSICYSDPDGGYLPSDYDGPFPVSSSFEDPGYFLNFNSLGSLGLFQLKPDFGNLANNPSLLYSTNIPVGTFQEACNGGACIPQPNTTEQLASLGDRLMYRLAFREVNGHEAMVVNHSVTAGSGVGVRWYELDAPTGGSGAFTVAQSGTFTGDPSDSSYRWMGSIAMDQAGDIALGYSRSSSSLYPGIYLAGQSAGSTGTGLGTETVLQAGGGSQTGYTRWGDYTSMQIDPSDDCTFWYADEYYPQTASYNWYTSIGSFKFSGCGSTGGSTSSADFSIAESPSPLTISAGSSSSSGSVTVTSLDGFNYAVSLDGCSAPLTCTFNPTSVTPPANLSKNSTMTVTVASNASAGTYVDTITGTDSTLNLTHSTTFTVKVPSSDFTISASQSSLTIPRGTQGTDTINLKSLSSSGSGNVNLSVSGLPSQTSASFTPNPVTVSSTTDSPSTLTISANQHGPRGTYILTITGNNGTYSESTQMTLTVQ